MSTATLPHVRIPGRAPDQVKDLVKAFNAKGMIEILSPGSGKTRHLKGLNAYGYMKRHADELGIPQSSFGDPDSGDKPTSKVINFPGKTNKPGTTEAMRALKKGDEVFLPTPSGTDLETHRYRVSSVRGHTEGFDHLRTRIDRERNGVIVFWPEKERRRRKSA